MDSRQIGEIAGYQISSMCCHEQRYYEMRRMTTHTLTIGNCEASYNISDRSRDETSASEIESESGSIATREMTSQAFMNPEKLLSTESLVSELQSRCKDSPEISDFVGVLSDMMKEQQLIADRPDDFGSVPLYLAKIQNARAGDALRDYANFAPITNTTRFPFMGDI
jgi:hypothetical protein